MSKIKVFITPTTHWDREWVMSFGQFQIRLVNLIDNMIKIMDSNKDYRFLMDGQAIALEDYLEIKPEQKAKISSLLQADKLIAGPWYVLADQFLENGESTIRNLLMGMSKVSELGGKPMKLGYIPDSFGSIATMPMIMAGFGIEYATFGRGRPEWSERLPHHEFTWEAPDGSRIVTASHGYSSGIFLSYPDIWVDIMEPASMQPDPEKVLKQFMEAAANQLKQAVSANLYFPVGIDHMEPRQSLVGIVDYINREQEVYELVYGMPEDYLAAVAEEAQELSLYKGEFRGSEENLMDLIGTLTSYIHLKQQNDYSELLLQRLVEPLWTMVSSLTGTPYPRGHLQKLWKLLLANHPHDSICGCSIDQVHKDMQNRFEQIHEIGVYLIKDGLHLLLKEINTITNDDDAIAITVVNPLGNQHTGPVKSLIRVPKRFNHKDYTLVDSSGNVIPARIIHLKDKNKDLESVYMTNQQLSEVLSKNSTEDRADSQVFTVLEVAFIAEDVPAMGYRTLWITPNVTSTAVSDISVKLCENGMENEFIKVAFHSDGTFDLLNKSTGHTFHKLNYLLDREEIGDLYDHHEFSLTEEFDSRTCLVEWKLFEQESFRITFKAVLDWELPQEVIGNNRSDVLKAMPIIMYVTIHSQTDRVEIAVEMDNACKDHCLRVAFDTGLQAKTVSAFDHFNVIERKAKAVGSEWRDEPFQQFVDVSDGVNGLCLSTKGLPAYEAFAENSGTSLQLTLIRSAGELGNAAGANHPNPGGQCQGFYRFEYALIPHSGSWNEGQCLQKSEEYRSLFLLEADIQHDGKLPATGSLLNITPRGDNHPYISCLKQAEDGDGWILRLWNSASSEQIKLKSDFAINQLQVTRLDECFKQMIAHIDDDIDLPACGLTTIRLGIGVV